MAPCGRLRGVACVSDHGAAPDATDELGQALSSLSGEPLGERGGAPPCDSASARPSAVWMYLSSSWGALPRARLSIRLPELAPP